MIIYNHHSYSINWKILETRNNIHLVKQSWCADKTYRSNIL